MSRRSEELQGVCRDLIAVHDAWVKNQNRPNPDAIYWDAVDLTLDAFEDGEIPSDCRLLSEAVEKLNGATERFHQRENEANEYPKNEFWEAIQGVRDALAGPQELRFKPLESMKDLREQKVPYWQIAKIYGLIDSNGTPQSHLVQKELDEPGSVINESWVDPRMKDRQQQQAAREESASAGDAPRKGSASSEPARTPCPESPRELWEQKVSVAQAAKMLCLPEDEVADVFAGFDEERDENEETRALKAAEQKLADAAKPKAGRRDRKKTPVGM